MLAYGAHGNSMAAPSTAMNFMGINPMAHHATNVYGGQMGAHAPAPPPMHAPAMHPHAHLPPPPPSGYMSYPPPQYAAAPGPGPAPPRMAMPMAPRPLSQTPPGIPVFVYHVATTVSEDDLAALFAPFGQITHIKLMFDLQTNARKPFAFVNVATLDQAAAVR